MGWLGNEGIDASLVSSLVTVLVHRDQFLKKCSSTLYGMTFGIQYLALDFLCLRNLWELQGPVPRKTVKFTPG